MKKAKTQKEFLAEIHQVVTRNDKSLSWIINDIPVNGSKGLENVLRTQHDKIAELYSLTAAERTKRNLVKSVREFVAQHSVLSGIVAIITDKRILVIVITTLLALLGIDISTHK